jgi:hypothetical protein
VLQICHHALTERHPSLDFAEGLMVAIGKAVSRLNKRGNIQIVSQPNEMTDGLFGQVILWVFEILPYLYAHRIFPDWKIRAALYGRASDGLIIPGVLDLAYQVAPGPKKEINLVQLRAHRRHALGNDFRRLSAVWNAYFRIPNRIAESAETFGSLADAIGIHYRGNDKQTSLWDTNPVSHHDYLLIIEEFIKNRPEFRRIFLATDDANFCQFLKNNLSMEIVNLGGVGFHKAEASRDAVEAKTDRAMLVLLTSSALPSFTKILNPDLEIYRVAASKFFTNTPYFPTAYIPIYKSSTPEISALVDRLMLGDWTQTADAELFTAPFDSRPYWPPIARLMYSYIKRLPGFKWAWRMPHWVAAYSRRRRTRLHQQARKMKP